jgi:hypothetical protein
MMRSPFLTAIKTALGLSGPSRRFWQEEKSQLVIAAREMVRDEHDEHQAERDQGRSQPERQQVQTAGSELLERADRPIEFVGQDQRGRRRAEAEAEAEQDEADALRSHRAPRGNGGIQDAELPKLALGRRLSAAISAFSRTTSG